MKILICTCIPFWAPRDEGGGVAVYINNLIPALLEKGHDVSFLSYGYKENPLRSSPYIRKSNNPYTKKGCKSYDLINSPVIAPSRFHTTNPQLSITPQEKLERCFLDFVAAQGKFDVIHFNSLEGITPQVLGALKTRFPEMRIYYSAHDYHPFCIGIRLYQENTCRICEDYHEGNSCVGCVSMFPNELLYRHARHYYYDSYNKVMMPGFLRKYLIKRSVKKHYEDIHAHTGRASDYQKYRQIFTEYINKYVDRVLVVSRRVGELVAEMGINTKLIVTSYIGTKVAETQLGYQANSPNSYFTLLFLGSASAPEKGFLFLLNALRKLPDEMAAKLNIIIAASGVSSLLLNESLKCVHSCKVYDGYNHEQLPEIMKSVHLGIVPSLWEDCLPQVAIEMVSHGVAVLASSAGGASELSDSEYFKFNAYDESNFIQKLTYIIEHPNLLDDYWKKHYGLTTIRQHIEQLELIYQQTNI